MKSGSHKKRTLNKNIETPFEQQINKWMKNACIYNELFMKRPISNTIKKETKIFVKQIHLLKAYT